MFRYTIKRILLMLMTLLIITYMCFVLVRMLPPAELPPNDPHKVIIELRREAAGYNKPYKFSLVFICATSSPSLIGVSAM